MSRIILHPDQPDRLMRMMERGHEMRTGHPLVWHYEESEIDGVLNVVRDCCPTEQAKEEA